MAIIVGGRTYRTVSDDIYVNGNKIYGVYVNGIKVYPDFYDTIVVTLTWNANPSDLDSHMVGPLPSGGTFHVYYSSKTAYDNGELICNLDVDDTTSYGPEHTTLHQVSDGPYYFYVHHYSGSGSIATSGAVVDVSHNGTSLRRYNAPSGSGKYWNVFKIIDNELIANGSITSSPDTSY